MKIFFEGVTESTPPYHRRCRNIHNNIINNEHRKNNIQQQSQFCVSVLLWEGQQTEMHALGAIKNGWYTNLFFPPLCVSLSLSPSPSFSSVLAPYSASLVFISKDW